MANEKKINYQLNTNALNNIDNLTDIIDSLVLNHHYIKSGSFDQNNQIFSQHSQFEVTYDKDKDPNQAGNIAPHVLRDLLVEIQIELVKNVSITGTLVYLPPFKNSPDWNKFYFQGVYENSTDSDDLEAIIDTLHVVVHGTLKKKDAEEGTDNKAKGISEFSLTFRQGNLINNWSKDGNGVLVFANHLLSINKYGKDTKLIKGVTFGRPKDEFYLFGPSLGALSEYHKEFKEKYKNHPNLKYPKNSDERKNLERLMNKNDDFFSGRGIILLDSYVKEGKLTTDNTDLDEFIEIYKAAIKALKAKAPETPTGGASDGDADGGADEEPGDKKDDKNIITFEGLYELVRGRLISFIYETYYQEAVKLVSSETQYETRNLILGIISIRIDSDINLRVLIKDKVSSDWQAHVEEEEIQNSEDLATDIETFVESIANNQFDFSTVINEDILQAQNSLVGIESPEKKATLPGLDSIATAKLIVIRLKDEKIFGDDFSEDDWDKLSSKDKVSYWKRLSLSERRKFLEDNDLLDYAETYADNIAIKYLEEQLSSNNISLSERNNFTNLLSEMSAQIEEDLISIPPTEFGEDTEIFLARREQEGFFLRMEQQWITEFAPTLEKEIANFSLHNPQFITHEFIQDKSFNEIATALNTNLTGDDGDIRINQAAELILNQIISGLDLPDGIILEEFDNRQSLTEIREYLKIYLRKNDINNLHLLYEGASLDSFVDKYTFKFLSAKSAFFLPLIEERLYLAHRLDIFKKIQRKIGIENDAQGKINFENTLYSILTQSALSEVNPEDYLNKLSSDDLDNLFGLSEHKIKLSEKDYDILRKLILQYLIARKKDLRIDNPPEVGTDEFTEDALFLKEQSKRLVNHGGGRTLYTAITYTPPSAEEEQSLIEAETELERLAKEDQIRQLKMAKAIFNAYTLEQQKLLIDQEAQNLAIYQQQQILNQQDTGKKEEKKKKRKGLIKKGVDKLKDKGLNTTATAASAAALNALIPGAGAAAVFINTLPISEKYKKYLTTGLLGGIVAGAGAVVYMVTHSALSALGGMIGLWFGGPIGFVAGASIGYGLEMVVKNFFGGILDGISGAANSFGSWVGNGLNNIFGGGSSVASQAAAPISQAGIGQIPGINTPGVTAGSGTSFGLTPGGLTSAYVAKVAVVTTTATIIGGGIFTTNALHTIFLQRVPEVNPDVGGTSKYVILEKTAIEGVDFDNPQEVTYSISITPKDGYEIQINPTPSDDFSFSCNEETRSDCPNNTNSPEFEDYRNFISRLIEISGLTIASGETLEVGTYTVPFNEDYVDASIKNTFEIAFSVTFEGEIISSVETAQTSESICFGECPALKEGCWPTDGIVKQAPYGSYSHGSVDAVDIANSSSPNVYSTTPGEACFFNEGSGASSVYGNHVIVKNGAFALLYGHFANLEEPGGTCVSVDSGTLLGVMGTTGNSSGIHLHWEMRKLGSGFLGYTSRIPGQSFGMTGQTLLEQHSPEGDKIKDMSDKKISTCYE